MKKELGKITQAEFGLGGYQDCMMTLDLTIEGKGWGVGTNVGGTWAGEPSDHAKWTTDDQTQIFGDMVREIHKILETAKVKHVSQLIGIPVECEFEGVGGRLENWRVLEEVL